GGWMGRIHGAILQTGRAGRKKVQIPLLEPLSQCRELRERKRVCVKWWSRRSRIFLKLRQRHWLRRRATRLGGRQEWLVRGLVRIDECIRADEIGGWSDRAELKLLGVVGMRAR